MSGAPGPRPGFLPQVESLRGLAALCVAYAHCGIVLLLWESSAPRAPESAALGVFALVPLDILANARAAVVLFFVISGLVLALALDRAAEGGTLRRFGAFLGRRALRIYPAHLVALLLFVPIAAATVFQLPIADPERFASPAAGMVHWVGDGVYRDVDASALRHTLLLRANTYNPVTWSVQVELVAALFLPAFAALSRRGRLPLDLAMLALIAAGGIAADEAIGHPALFLYLPAFYLGCMVRTHGRTLMAAAARHALVAIVAAAAVVLLVVPEGIVGPHAAHRAVVLGMAAGGFLLVSAVAWASTRAADAVFLHPLARGFGRISYSFFLWHCLLLFAIVRLELALIPAETLVHFDQILKGATFLVSTAAAAAVAALSYRFVERPFMNLGRRRPAPPREAPSLAASEAAA